MDLEYKAEQAELDRQKDITVAEIRAAGYGSMADINKNQQSDYQDFIEGMRSEQRYQDQMNLKRESELTKKEQGGQKLQIEREKLQTQKEIAEKQLQIARENKTKSELKASGKLKEK
jgi:hypothetical protein